MNLARIACVLLSALIFARAPVSSQEKKPDLAKQIDDALKELNKGKEPPPAPEAPRQPAVNPRPANPGGQNVFGQMEQLQKQMEAMNRIFGQLDNLQKPGKEGEAIENLTKQLADLNLQGGGRVNDPLDLMIQQLQIINKIQNEPQANPFLILQRQMQLMEIVNQGQGVKLRQPVRLGVALQVPPRIISDQLDLPAGQGLIIEEVIPDTPAQKAGLKANDVLLEIAGKAVPNEVAAFQRMIGAFPLQNPVDLLIIRKGKKELIQGIQFQLTRQGGNS